MSLLRTLIVGFLLLVFPLESQAGLVGRLPLIELNDATRKTLREPKQYGLTNSDIIALAQNGLSDKIIISAIRARGGHFQTNAQALIELHNKGVSAKVIMEMQRHDMDEWPEWKR